ncbi:MAG: septum site-determining protein MinC [Alphaproteobacteria bacterium]
MARPEAQGVAATSVVPFQIRGRSFTAVVLELTGAADPAFYAALDAKLAQAPHFFSNAPFVIDLDRAHGLSRSGDFTGLVRELRGRRLSIVGVQNGTMEQNTAALTAGLIPLQGGRDIAVAGGTDTGGTDEGDRPAAAIAEQAEAEHRPGTLVLTEPVRSGQRIFADSGDLVVVASVGSGAELIAVGNIHVYGSLRGRALAGVNGDGSARIFCASLEAELIAIAGLYKTSDDIGGAHLKQRVQAYLRDDSLVVEPLK